MSSAIVGSQTRFLPFTHLTPSVSLPVCPNVASYVLFPPPPHPRHPSLPLRSTVTRWPRQRRCFEDVVLQRTTNTTCAGANELRPNRRQSPVIANARLFSRESNLRCLRCVRQHRSTLSLSLLWIMWSTDQLPPKLSSPWLFFSRLS